MTLPASSTAPERRLRVLVVTKLFPNRVRPSFSVFNRLQMVALSRFCDVDIRATVPWFPAAGAFAKWSEAGQFVDVPGEEIIDELKVLHPRFIAIPKIGRTLAPALYAASLWPGVRHLKDRVDVVLGCWAFPDGLAAILLARWLNAASVVKVHGSDLNVLARNRTVGRLLSRGLPEADRLVAVSRPLGERAIELGVDRRRLEIVSNGVDREVFQVRDRGEARARLDLPVEKKLVVYVGRLDRAKGVLDLLDAFERLAAAHPALNLALVGSGPELARCQQFAAQQAGRIFLPGALPMAKVAEWLAACDILTLPSWNEGTPNVLLEAFACGRRVVATNVGGIPDVVTSPQLGTLVAAHDVSALANALAEATAAPYDPLPLTAAAPYSWPESGARLRDVLEAAVAQRRARAPGGARAVKSL
jgi:teichuronic acid biosynthesis glycosyltransferase TuaC